MTAHGKSEHVQASASDEVRQPICGREGYLCDKCAQYKRDKENGLAGGIWRKCTGTPSLEEDARMWKACLSEPDVTSDEYFESYRQLTSLLQTIGVVGFTDECDFYFIGDNLGDRTQYLEIVNPESLNEKLIRDLQGFLRPEQFRNWRIRIPTYLESCNDIMVYPEAVRTHSRYGDDLPKAFADIIPKMRAAQALESQD